MRVCVYIANVLYKNNIGGEGLAVLCNVVGAATVYKTVKSKYTK